MNKIKKPNSALTEVLYELLTNESISNANLPYMWGFRARISDLIIKYGIGISSSKEHAKNKHGRAYSYVKHKLTNKKHALKTYNELV